MDYQELVTSYNNKGLDIADLKEKLEIAKPLKGRDKFRALDMIPQRSALINDTSNVLIISEIPDRVEVFYNDTQNVLQEYFEVLVQSIRNAKAWKFMKLVPSEYSSEIFEGLSDEKKFEMLFELNQKYLAFLQYQKIADIRDCLRNDNSDETIRKLQFLISMFDSFKNREIKNEFFCFDKKFLMALIDFRKSKCLRLEDFIKTKKKNVQQEYDKFLNFFTNEDFRHISENLVLTSKTLRTTIGDVIEAFSELSESQSEISYLEDEYKEFKKLEKKYLRMNVVKVQYEKEKVKREKIEFAKRLAEEKKRKTLEEIQKKKEAEQKIKLEKDQKKKQIEEKLKERLKQVNKPAKEQVNPLIFSWLEKEDLSLTRRIGNKKVVEMFDKIKQIQSKTGVRISLYIVTNAGKEVSLKRLQDFQKKAATNGLPNLVEGVLGGYSTFRIDSSGKITDLAVMSDVNKNKIINLLENTKSSNLTKDKLESENDSYLRYQISCRKDKSINKEYLNLLVKNILTDERVRRQPLKFLPYMEGKFAGIDVLLESQLKGISQLPDYYKLKYNIAPGKTINVRIDQIDNFIKDS